LKNQNKQIMEIKVLGTGCPKCKKLEQKTREAVDAAGIEANISKVEDITKIMAYGIMKTPGLVINEEVVFSGRIPSEKELNEILTQNK